MMKLLCALILSTMSIQTFAGTFDSLFGVRGQYLGKGLFTARATVDPHRNVFTSTYPDVLGGIIDGNLITSESYGSYDPCGDAQRIAENGAKIACIKKFPTHQCEAVRVLEPQKDDVGYCTVTVYVR